MPHFSLVLHWSYLCGDHPYCCLNNTNEDPIKIKKKNNCQFMCLSICRFLSSIVQVNFPDTQASTRSLQCRWSRPGEHGWINHRNPLRTLNRTKNKTKPDPEGCISGCILDWLYLITVLFGSRFAVDMPLWVPTEHYWLFQNAVKSQVFLCHW